MRRTLTSTLTLFAAFLVSGCSDAPTSGFDVPLVVDRNVNSPTQVVSALRAVRVVVDSPEGLYEDGSRPVDSDAKLEDLDGDKMLELWDLVEIDELGRLPRIRIEQGGLRRIPIDLRFEGFGHDGDPAPEVVAAGGVRGLQFEPGQIREVEVPFNLKLRFRAPQVTQVIPADGEVAGEVASILVVFAKRMDAASLRRPGAIELRRVEPDGSERPVLPDGEIRVQYLPAADLPTTAEYRLANTLPGGQYRIVVSPLARDADGRALDQVPMQPENRGFSSTFTIEGTSKLEDMATAATAETCFPTPCINAPCHLGGTICGSGLICEDGACVPERCPVDCGEGLVCDPTVRVCLADCRLHGAHGGCDDPARPSCSADDGLCH